MLIKKSENKTNIERNRTTKSRKNQNDRKKGKKLPESGNIGSGHHQTSGNGKIRIVYLRKTRKLLETKP